MDEDAPDVLVEVPLAELDIGPPLDVETRVLDVAVLLEKDEVIELDILNTVIVEVGLQVLMGSAVTVTVTVAGHPEQSVDEVGQDP